MATNQGVSINLNEIPDDIIIEVLARLPIKSLLRFKSVSTNWFFLFTYNQAFRAIHRARANVRQGGVLHVIAPENCYSRNDAWDRRIFCIDMKKPPNARASVIEPDPTYLPFDTNTTSNMVNGVICFYNRYDEVGSIYVYNLTTREILPLPRTKESSSFRKCLLGFDPKNNEYKLLRFWTPDIDEIPMKCEVIRLLNKDKGCTTSIHNLHKGWSDIDISHIQPTRACEGFCLNGILYWKSERGIIVFEVKEETFAVVNYPADLRGVTTLAHIQGHLSFVGFTSMEHYQNKSYNPCLHYKITWWKLVDQQKRLWTTSEFMCPFPSIDNGVLRHHVCCNHLGQVFAMRCYPDDYMWKWYYVFGDNMCIIDCYDMNTGRYKELHVNNSQAILSSRHRFQPSQVVENIIPLKNIIRS